MDYSELKTFKLLTGGEFVVFSPVNVERLPAHKQNQFSAARLEIGALAKARDRAECESIVEKYMEKLQQVLQATGNLYHEVRVSKGKTEKSKRVEIRCYAGEVGGKKITSSFYVPTSMVIVAGGESGKGYLPAWFVKNKLDEVRKNSMYSSQRYERIPIKKPFWPEELKSDLREKLVAQLPASSKFEAIERKRQEKREQLKKKRELEQQRHQAWEKEQAKEQEKRRLKHEEHLSKLEQYHGASARWSKSVKNIDGTYGRKEYEADNVSIYISGGQGKKVYIVHPDGKEVVAMREHVEFDMK